MISPDLVELRARLEDAGVVVVQEPDYLTIRLPFFCSVRVKSNEGRLHLEGFFGLYGRVRSTTLKLIGMAAVAFVAARYGMPYMASMAVLSLMVGFYETIRWILTEHAITRVSTIRSLSPRGLSPMTPVTGDTTARFAPVNPTEAQRSGRHATPVAPEASSPRSR